MPKTLPRVLRITRLHLGTYAGVWAVAEQLWKERPAAGCPGEEGTGKPA
jgi:hypothetical protein